MDFNNNSNNNKYHYYHYLINVLVTLGCNIRILIAVSGTVGRSNVEG